MNNEMNMVELSDEQLETVSGGNYGYHANGVNLDVNVNTNVAVIVPTIVSPTVNVSLFSKNVNQSGSINFEGVLAGQKNQ